MLDETVTRLRTVFRTDNALTLPISGTGSAGMEACFVNLLEPGDTAIVGVNGVFGERMCEVARRCGAEVVRVDEPSGAGRSIRSACSTRSARIRDARLVAVVHAETSTGVENDVAPLAALRDTDTLLLVDTVTSLGGIPVEIDGWGVDAALLGHPEVPRRAARPLAGHVLDRAVERVQRRAHAAAVVVPRPRRSSPTTSAARAAYHHTAPISMVFALHAGARRRARRGARGRVGAPPRGRRRGSRRALPELGFRLVVAEEPPAPGAHDRRGCPTAPTTRRCARRCSTDLRHRGRRRARRRSPGKALAHRPHGPLGPRALGHHAPRRAPRAALTLANCVRPCRLSDAGSAGCGAGGGTSMCSR